ncbi:MAG: Sec-independent protein translocase protein TatB, partial [Rhizobiaceae bacterium]
MFDIGYSELLVIAIVLIVVVGPKDLPKMLRAFGKTMTKFRQMSGDFQRQFNEALKEAELDDVRKTIADVRSLDPRQQVRDVFNPLREAGNSLKADLNKPVSTPTPVVNAPSMSAPSPVEETMSETKSDVKDPDTQEVASAPSKKTVKKTVSKAAPVTSKPDTTKPETTKPVAAKPKQ